MSFVIRCLLAVGALAKDYPFWNPELSSEERARDRTEILQVYICKISDTDGPKKRLKDLGTVLIRKI